MTSKKPTFLRFAVDKRDEDSEVATGIFQAAADLRGSAGLSPAEEDLLWDVRDWFNEHLERPARFSRSRFGKRRGISWFKSSAAEHLRRIHQVIKVLNDHGVRVHMIKSSRPGYIIYEDEHQIVAEPFKEGTF